MVFLLYATGREKKNGEMHEARDETFVSGREWVIFMYKRMQTHTQDDRPKYYETHRLLHANEKTVHGAS